MTAIVMGINMIQLKISDKFRSKHVKPPTSVVMPVRIKAAFIFFNPITPSLLSSSDFGILVPNTIGDFGPVYIPIRIRGKLISNNTIKSIIFRQAKVIIQPFGTSLQFSTKPVPKKSSFMILLLYEDFSWHSAQRGSLHQHQQTQPSP